MQSRQTRRRLLLTLSSTTAAGLLGVAKISAQEALPETTTIRLAKIPGVCIAPGFFIFINFQREQLVEATKARRS